MKNWRTYERHPISARYPNLKGEAWEEFLDNFKRRRRAPTLILFEDKILDGWQRYRGCLETDTEPKFSTLRQGEDPEAYVEEHNDFRRHETPEAVCLRREQRRERIAEKRKQGRSLRKIAEEEGVDQATVRRDLSSAGVAGATPEPESGTITGQDGKTYTPRPRKKRDRKPKSGSIFDVKDIHPLLGALVRFLDKFGNVYNCKQTPAIEGLRRLLSQFLKDFRTLAEFKMKKVLPE